MNLLRGRRMHKVDPGQYRLDDEPRGRAARRVRALVREGIPVLLRHQRWAGVKALFEDLAIDLRVADAPVRASPVNFSSLGLREDPRGWAVLLQAVFGALDERPPAAQVPLSSDAFEDALTQAFDASAARGPYALLCRGVEAIPVRALELVSRAHLRHRQRHAEARTVRLVLASSGGAAPSLDGARAVTLPDMSVREGVGMLVERGVDLPRDLLDRLVWTLGGVPEWLEHTAAYRGPLEDPDWRRVLGTPYLHLRNALALVRADDASAARLDALADLAPHPALPEVDAGLFEAGLVVAWPEERAVRLRAPLVAKVDKTLTA